MPLESVVIWSSSTGSFSSATCVASPRLPAHVVLRVSCVEALDNPRAIGRTVRGRNMSMVVMGCCYKRYASQKFKMTWRHVRRLSLSDGRPLPVPHGRKGSTSFASLVSSLWPGISAVRAQAHSCGTVPQQRPRLSIMQRRCWCCCHSRAQPVSRALRRHMLRCVAGHRHGEHNVSITW
jgi:hypothetical protein